MWNKEKQIRWSDDVCNKRAQDWCGWWYQSGEWRRQTIIKNRRFLKIVVQHHTHVFLVVDPREWANLLIELCQSWKVKVTEITLGEEVACNAKWLGGCKTFDAGLFAWWFTVQPIKLTEMIVSGLIGSKGMSSSEYGNRSTLCFLSCQDGLCTHSILYKVPSKDLTIHQGPVKGYINLLMQPCLASECVACQAKTKSPLWCIKGSRRQELISLQC